MSAASSTRKQKQQCTQATSPASQVAEATPAAQPEEQDDVSLADRIALQVLLWGIVIQGMIALKDLLMSLLAH
jgi:hypothetical protein